MRKPRPAGRPYGRGLNDESGDRMSTQQNTATSLPTQPPLYLTAVAAAEVMEVAKDTVITRITPDAWYASARGDKTWPLWLRSTVERHRDERQGGAE